MFDDGSSQPHGIGGGALMHVVEGVFIEMTADESLRRGRAFRLEWTGPADIRLRYIGHAALFAVLLLAGKESDRPDRGSDRLLGRR